MRVPFCRPNWNYNQPTGKLNLDQRFAGYIGVEIQPHYLILDMFFLAFLSFPICRSQCARLVREGEGR